MSGLCDMSASLLGIIVEEMKTTFGNVFSNLKSCFDSVCDGNKALGL